MRGREQEAACLEQAHVWCCSLLPGLGWGASSARGGQLQGPSTGGKQGP